MKTSKTIFTLFLLCSVAVLFACNRTASYGGAGKKGGSGNNFSVGKKQSKTIQHQNKH